MATEPMPDPITQMYERVHHEWTAAGSDGERGPFTARSGNQMLAVAALLAEVALRYDDLDRRLHAVEARLDALAE